MANSTPKQVFGKKNVPNKSYPDEKPLVDIQIVGRPGKKCGPADVKRLTHLVNTIAENSPFGRAVLEDAAKAGYTLTMEKQKDTCGFCEAGSAMIVLNPSMDDGLLVATLAHESRHAQQFIRGATAEYGCYDVRGEVMHNRALEADAETAAAATCHEIRVNSGNAAPWNSFAEDSVDIAEGFMNAAPDPESPVTDKMLQGAFEGWYKDVDMMEAYEADITDVMQEMMEDEDFAPYDEKLKSADVVNLFCHNAAGKCYWADRPDVLENADKLSIAPETHDVAEEYFAKREKLTGEKPDPSLNTLKVRGSENDPATKEAGKTQQGMRDRKINPVTARIVASLAARRR